MLQSNEEEEVIVEHHSMYIAVLIAFIIIWGK